jgi:hypothetical protein
MIALPFGRTVWSLVKKTTQWCHHSEPDFTSSGLWDESEAEHIAKDVGLTPSEFRTVRQFGPDAADLMLKRLVASDLNPDEVSCREHSTFQDMQRVCTLCGKHKRCAQDFARNPSDSAWKEYCPNVETILELDALPWAARGEW